MASGKETLFERYLAPLMGLFIDEKALLQSYESIDWQNRITRLQQPDFEYPDYYQGQNFHGVKGGYLTPQAAMSYDPITQYALPPNEQWVRQGLIDRIQGKPRRILDLGCGTGTTTQMLKRSFPDAEVIGLDLSPYMLVMAEDKAQQANLPIAWVHGQAEQTPFPDTSFDLVTIALLFHETPAAISRAILAESYRLLTVGGEVLVLDGCPKTLRQMHWITEIFEEPYIQEFVAGNVDAWLGAAGFGAIQHHDLWWLHQIWHGIKPIPGQDPDRARVQSHWDRNLEQLGAHDLPQPAFGSVG